MSVEEFENYNFSINTRFVIKGTTIAVLAVNFDNYSINGIPILAIDKVFQMNED